MDEIEAAIRSTARPVRRHKRENAEHAAAVIAGLKAGKRPTDVAEWSAFTATHVRKLAREAGIPPARRGKSSRREPG